MSGKSPAVPSQATSTTPHRLRSGTHYGSIKTEPPNSAKKEAKKSAKECQVPDRDLFSKGDKNTPVSSTCPRDARTDQLTTTDRIVTVALPGMSSSPKAIQKGQNLKAILESIQPSVCVKGKPVTNAKRKTLRDLLDQKLYKDHLDPQPLFAESADVSLAKILSNKENNQNTKSFQDKEVSTDLFQVIKSGRGVSPNRITAHTQTRLHVSEYARVKQEPPDDFWAMKMSYVEKRPVPSKAVELRIKAEGRSGQQDDHSQTFRISCSRPDAANSSSTALTRNMKPDIVLKVKPRSSMQPSAVDRALPHNVTSRPVNSYKTVSRFHGRLEPQTTIFSTISPINVASRPCLPAREEESKILYGRGMKQQSTLAVQTQRFPGVTSGIHAVSVLLQGDNSVLPKPSTNCLSLDIFGHGDVLEESKIPPVANTVELLSEPHVYNIGPDVDPFSKPDDIVLFAPLSCSSSTQQGQPVCRSEQLQPDSPPPPVLEPIQPLVKSEPRYDEPESGAGWSLETSLCLRREDPMMWRDIDQDQDTLHRKRLRSRHFDDDEEDNDLMGGCSMPGLTKDRSDEDEDEEVEQEEESGQLEKNHHVLETVLGDPLAPFSAERSWRGPRTQPRAHLGSAETKHRQASRRSKSAFSSCGSTPLSKCRSSTPASSCSSSTYQLPAVDSGDTQCRPKDRSGLQREHGQNRWQVTPRAFEGEEEEEAEVESDPDEDVAGKGQDLEATRKSACLTYFTRASLEKKGCVGRKVTGKQAAEKGGKGGGRVRGGRRSMDPEVVWANPQLDTHAFLLWASENRGDAERRHRGVSAEVVEEVLSSQWRQLPFSGKLQYLCRARDADTDHNKHTMHRKKVDKDFYNNSYHHNHHHHHHNNHTNRLRHNPADGAPTQHNDYAGGQQQSAEEGRLVYEEFLRLPQERQKDLLRKWLRFFQKMLPRLEYQEFISDFKRACRTLQLRPVPARRKNARLRNLDPSHYHMLFEKIRETRPRVISVYNKRKAREEELLRKSFSVMIRRLVNGQHWPFVRGCRSKVLGDLMKDIQQLEVEEVLAQIELPLAVTPADLCHPFAAHETSESVSAPENGCAEPQTPGTEPSQNASSREEPGGSQTHGSANKSCSNNNACVSSSLFLDCSDSNCIITRCVSLSSGHSSSLVSYGHSGVGTSQISDNNDVENSSEIGCASPGRAAELPDSPYVLALLQGLQLAAELPVLDQPCLDTVFLMPPLRSSTSAASFTSSSSSTTSAATPSSSTSTTSCSSSGCLTSAGSRGQIGREAQYQNSATYRRTLLYKHIQPLLDTRGMPLTTTALYRPHSTQFFFPDDR